MAAMPNPVKDTKAYNYRYETLDQVLGIVQPPLMERGMFARQCSTLHEDGQFILYTYIVDTVDDVAHCMDMRPLKYGDDQQRNGSFETYARRYALKTVFGLCGEDDDGAATSEKPAKTGNQVRNGKKAPQTAPDGLVEAKQRMWAAIKSWAERHGRTPDDVLQGVRKRPDWAETSEFFAGVAAEFEGDLD